MRPMEKIADWISGGALTRARMIAKFQHQQSWEYALRFSELESVLERIAAMETPNCAPIGKRMAKVAREALE